MSRAGAACHPANSRIPRRIEHHLDGPERHFNRPPLAQARHPIHGPARCLATCFTRSLQHERDQNVPAEAVTYLVRVYDVQGV